MLCVRMRARPLRRFIGLLVMLGMATQASPVLCVAAVCLQQVSHAGEPRATDLEWHANHSHDPDPGEPGEDPAPSGHVPIPPHCEAMALCTMALFEPALEFADSLAVMASGPQFPAVFVLFSRTATLDTPPPRA
jgi:hypothetical protein